MPSEFLSFASLFAFPASLEELEATVGGFNGP
jgi:hypothetical protein